MFACTPGLKLLQCDRVSLKNLDTVYCEGRFANTGINLIEPF